MSRTTTRFIGAAAALLAAGLAGFSLRRPAAYVDHGRARNPAADVRTQVIRRTVHIVRHEHGRHAAGSRGVGATGPDYPGRVRFGPRGGHPRERLTLRGAERRGGGRLSRGRDHTDQRLSRHGRRHPRGLRCPGDHAYQRVARRRVGRLHGLGRTRHDPHQPHGGSARRKGRAPAQRRRRRGRRRWWQWRLNPARFDRGTASRAGAVGVGGPAATG